MNIATALLQAIKERGLDNLFQVEEAASRQPKAAILATLRGQTDDPETTAHPTPEDQLRLVVIYFLSVADHAMPREDLTELTGILKEAGADVAALEYVKKVREVTRMTMMATQPAMAAPAQGGEWTKGFSALGNRVSSVFQSFGRTGLGNELSGRKVPEGEKRGTGGRAGARRLSPWRYRASLAELL